MCEGLRDYVGLWQIVRFVADEAHAQSEEALQAAVLEELSRLLDASVFEAVDLVEGGGSEAWPGDVNDILTRIREEWNLRGRPPNIPDMPWLRLTPLGRSVAEPIDAERR